MAAVEFGDPVTFVILVVSRDSSVHERILIAWIGVDTRALH